MCECVVHTCEQKCDAAGCMKDEKQAEKRRNWHRMWQATFSWICKLSISGSLVPSGWWKIHFWGEMLLRSSSHSKNYLEWFCSGCNKKCGKGETSSSAVAWISGCSPQGNSVLLSSKSDLLCGVQQANNSHLRETLFAQAWMLGGFPQIQHTPLDFPCHYLQKFRVSLFQGQPLS